MLKLWFVYIFFSGYQKLCNVYSACFSYCVCASCTQKRANNSYLATKLCQVQEHKHDFLWSNTPWGRFFFQQLSQNLLVHLTYLCSPGSLLVFNIKCCVISIHLKKNDAANTICCFHTIDKMQRKSISFPFKATWWVPSYLPIA